MTTQRNTDALSFTVLSSTRAKDGQGRSLRSVTFRLDHVAAPGCDWTKDGPSRVVELTAFDGNAIEVYVVDPTDGIPMYQGTIRSYAPADDCLNSVVNTFARAWFGEQKSQAARESFRASCERNW